MNDTKTVAKPTFPLAPSAVRYIKLGPGNVWFRSCLEHNRIEFGHSGVAHELALSGDKAAINAAYSAMGSTRSKASDFTREISDFYRLDENCLWITFAEGALWWAFAQQQVYPIERGDQHGERYRPLVAPWSSHDANGRRLSFNSLSSRLTQVAAYRQTLCKVEASDYLVRRINGLEEPVVVEARAARQTMLTAAEKLIAQLHWRDFEVLCDLIFARSGWQRVAELGGLQKDTDLVLEQSATGERAFVQIKSEASQATLEDYLERFLADPVYDLMFFACHSPRTRLAVEKLSRPVHIWTGETLARQAISAGLMDWLIKKAL